MMRSVASKALSQQITGWLADWRHGSDEARDRLFATLHPQLRQIASRFLHNERSDHTLEPNALVNELCIRLLGAESLTFQDRAHFLAVAAQTMRRILIDHARARVAGKRGGVQQRVGLSAVDGWRPISRTEDVVELRFFGGLTEAEVADVLGVSAITVKRDWKVARAWLVNRLQQK
jgi:DNA-directed RNA polymerase specialized sigma24 family protein